MDPQAGWRGRYINVRHCRGLSIVLLQLKDPLELFVKRGEFIPSSGFLSRNDKTYSTDILIPAPVDWTFSSAWLYKHRWITCQMNKLGTPITHVAC